MVVMNSRRLTDPSGSIASSSRNTSQEPVMHGLDEVVYIALGKDVKECTTNLGYALRSSVGKKICILHVHEPAKKFPILGTKFPASAMKEEEVKAYRELERQDVHKILDEFLVLCYQAGAQAEKLYFEFDKIEKGIVELISLCGIRKLVIGAAANKHYSRKMTKIKSKKAMHVHLKAPAFCQIQFVCKGQLICIREACSDEGHTDFPPPLPLAQNIEGLSLRPVQSDRLNGRNRDTLSPDVVERLSISESISNAGLTWSPFEQSHSSCSSSRFIDAATSRTEEDESADDSLHIQLEQAIIDATSAKQEAFREAIRRRKAERELNDALRRVKFSETLYAEELKQRKEIVEALAKKREELDYVKNQVKEMTEDLQIARNKELDFENQLAESNLIVRDLEKKIFSAIELLHIHKIKRDDLQRQYDKALKEVEEMRTRQVETTSEYASQFFSEFSFSEIAKATQNFDPSLMIGEREYGSIYKGVLCNTEVAIKVLRSHTTQSQHEVGILSKVKHPNILTLLGASSDAAILVYDYFANGSLEDRLVCVDNSFPLSWKIRIRIATELCSALIFLHSSRPYKVIHGDLKPMNIFLDANYVCKLGEFKSCYLLRQDENSRYNEKLFFIADTKETHEYMDPEILWSGKVTTKSDVYSFGIVLLRLLTGKSAVKIKNEVQFAIGNGTLKDILDPLAGEWPFVQAEQVAKLALRCCNTSSMNRPELSEVWMVLDPMRAFCGGSFSFFLGSGEGQVQPPSYFICPIFQDIMQDPQVAADGFTYEAEALRGWLDSGRDTSPMTNLKLPHQNLIPNHALRSTIQDWLHQHR